MPPAIPFLVQAAITLAVSAATALVSKALAKKKTRPQQNQPRPDAVKGMTVDEVGPQIGILGRHRVGGRVVFADTKDTATWFVLCIAGAPITNVNNVYVNDVAVTFATDGRTVTGAINPSENIGYLTFIGGGGFTTIVEMFTGEQIAASDLLRTVFPDKWSGEHIGYQLTYAVCKIDHHGHTTTANDIAKSFPEISFDINGFAAYDPRDTLQFQNDRDSWKFSENPAVVLGGYLTHTLGMSIPVGEIDWDAIADAADTCDETVTTKDGSSVVRYTCSATWTTDNPHEQVTQEIANTMAGELIPPGKKWSVRVGRFDAAIDTLVASDTLGELNLSENTPIEALFNGVRGTFISPEEHWEARDYPAVVSETYRAMDGRELWADIRFPYVRSHEQAQRLASIALKQSRLAKSIDVTVKMHKLNLIAGDVIEMTDEEAGIVGETVRIERNRLNPDLTIEFELTTETEEMFQFDPATEEGDYFPEVSDPTISGTNEPPAIKMTIKGAIGAKFVTVEMFESISEDTASYEVDFSTNGGVDWTSLFTPSHPAAGVTFDTATYDEAVQSQLDFRFRSVSEAALNSAYRTAVADLTAVAGTDQFPTLLTPSPAFSFEAPYLNPGFVFPIIGAQNLSLADIRAPLSIDPVPSRALLFQNTVDDFAGAVQAELFPVNASNKLLALGSPLYPAEVSQTASILVQSAVTPGPPQVQTFRGLSFVGTWDVKLVSTINHGPLTYFYWVVMVDPNGTFSAESASYRLDVPARASLST